MEATSQEGSTEDLGHTEGGVSSKPSSGVRTKETIILQVGDASKDSSQNTTLVAAVSQVPSQHTVVEDTTQTGEKRNP